MWLLMAVEETELMGHDERWNMSPWLCNCVGALQWTVRVSILNLQSLYSRCLCDVRYSFVSHCFTTCSSISILNVLLLRRPFPHFWPRMRYAYMAYLYF